jgi:hypothetical protein
MSYSRVIFIILQVCTILLYERYPNRCNYHIKDFAVNSQFENKKSDKVYIADAIPMFFLLKTF